jgi:protein-tyrosine phosphatase
MITKSEKIQNYDEFQNDAKLLFVCTIGLLRSATASNIAIKMGYNSRCCGSDINNALIPISEKLIKWADKIFFINNKNYKDAEKYFKDDMITLMRLENKRWVWNIPDKYDYNDPELIEIITKQLHQYRENYEK